MCQQFLNSEIIQSKEHNIKQGKLKVLLDQYHQI